jgi:phosphatidylinositol kinase/protein kinase (PI-3  family)
MDSNAAPLWLVFENTDPMGSPIQVIFKTGDDLRQDILTLQMLREMDRIWKGEGLDLQLTVYGCVATGPQDGMIQVVPNSTTTGRIQKEYAGASGAFSKEPLSQWLASQNPVSSSP